MKSIFFLCFIALLPTLAFAQPGSSTARHYTRKAIEKKADSTYRKDGRKAVNDVTYDNDKRYKDPNNKVQATIIYNDTSFKRGGKVRDVTSSTTAFGKTGEAYVTRDELKGKDESWLIFNYADKANYMVFPSDKTAMKMPLINFQKMIEKAAAKEAERQGDGQTVVATDQYATIAGHRARLFKTKGLRGEDMDLWIAKDLRLELGNNYMMGARLNAYKFPDNGAYKDMAGGFVVRTVMYDKKGEITWTRTLREFTKGKADARYFDLSPYKVNDVLGGL